MLIRMDSRHMRQIFVAFTIFLACFSAIAPTTFAETGHPETLAPLVTDLGIRALDVEYQLWYYVNVVFESEVTQTANDYEYRYRLTNKGDTQVRVQWRALEESAFADTVDTIEELRMGLLEPGTVSDWRVLSSSAAPKVSESAARMFGSAPSGEEAVQFSGPAPAYIPQ